MFRPNRIGTPRIYQSSTTANAAAWTLTAQGNGSIGATGNVINAAAIADFGMSALNNTNAQNLAIDNAFCLVQQFTVTKPLSGNTVGVELNASLKLKTDRRVIIKPVLFKAATAAGTVLGAVSSVGVAPVSIAPEFLPGSAALTDWFGFSYQTQVIIQDASAVEGTYCHGFQIGNNTGAALSIAAFQMDASLRQLNDQQAIGYKDTLR